MPFPGHSDTRSPSVTRLLAGNRQSAREHSLEILASSSRRARIRYLCRDRTGSNILTRSTKHTREPGLWNTKCVSVHDSWDRSRAFPYQGSGTASFRRKRPDGASDPRRHVSRSNVSLVSLTPMAVPPDIRLGYNPTWTVRDRSKRRGGR